MAVVHYDAVKLAQQLAALADQMTQASVQATRLVEDCATDYGDARPVDLNALVEQLRHEIDQTADGIWGEYGPPSAPTHYLVRLIRENADAIENRTGKYIEPGATA